MEYQIYTQDNTGRVLHAGVHKLGHISTNTIKKLERKWQLWRHEYINNHPGNYPLAEERALTPKFITIFPVNEPKNQRLFTL